MLIDLENIVGCKGYYIDDQTYEIWSYKRKQPRKIKLCVDSIGYSVFCVCNEGKPKNIKYHQLIVRLFIDPNYDSKTQQIDHIDRNKLNNSINNLKVVSKSENQNNKPTYHGRQSIYLDEIGDNIPVNAEHEVYYSKTLDKFFRYVEHTNQYRELHERKSYAHMRISYKYNKKNYDVNTTKFREALKVV